MQVAEGARLVRMAKLVEVGKSLATTVVGISDEDE